MTARLWIRDAPGKLREQRLDESSGDEGVVVGRDAAADIVLDDSAVSRFHARFVFREEGWHVIDLGSSNRTFVNGDPVREVSLSAGDHIGIGDCELQFVDEIDGIAYFNDSKATNMASVAAGVHGFDRPYVLILGGRSKGDREALEVVIHALRGREQGRERSVVGFGESGPELVSSLSDAVLAADLNDAVRKATALARPGDAVILSPGGSSFDMYANYMERGDAFVAAVNKLRDRN